MFCKESLLFLNLFIRCTQSEASKTNSHHSIRSQLILSDSEVLQQFIKLHLVTRVQINASYPHGDIINADITMVIASSTVLLHPLAVAALLVELLDQHRVRQAMALPIQVIGVGAAEVVAKCTVAGAQEVPEVRPHGDDGVRPTQLRCAGHLHVRCPVPEPGGRGVADGQRWVDIQHDVLHELAAAERGLEPVPVVVLDAEADNAVGGGVEEGQRVGDPDTEHERPEPAERAGRLPRKEDEVIAAHRAELNGEGVPVAVCVALGVMRHELPRRVRHARRREEPPHQHG